MAYNLPKLPILRPTAKFKELFAPAGLDVWDAYSSTPGVPDFQLEPTPDIPTYAPQEETPMAYTGAPGFTPAPTSISSGMVSPTVSYPPSTWEPPVQPPPPAPEAPPEYFPGETFRDLGGALGAGLGKAGEVLGEQFKGTGYGHLRETGRDLEKALGTLMPESALGLPRVGIGDVLDAVGGAVERYKEVSPLRDVPDPFGFLPPKFQEAVGQAAMVIPAFAGVGLGGKLGKVAKGARASYPPAKPPIEPPTATGGVTPPPSDWQTVVKRLVEDIKAAGPVREEQEALYSAERVNRLGGYFAVRGKATTQQEALRARGMLKGELPKAEYQPVAEKYSGVDLTALSNRIWQASEEGLLRGFEVPRTDLALFKLLNGGVPQESELALLERAFGSDLIRAVMSKGPRNWPKIAASLINIPRAMGAALDASNVGRQGALYMFAHPIKGAKAAKTSIKALGSEDVARAAEEAIRADPYYNVPRLVEGEPVSLTQAAGLAITERGIGARLAAREEQFATAFAENIPWVRWSQRSATTFLNKARMDIFTARAAQMEKRLKVGLGEAPLKEYQRIASAANKLTGRGSLGPIEDWGPALSAGLFSPRLFVSRLQAPFGIVSRSPEVRKETARAYASFILTNLGLLVIAQKAGIVDVEWDPRSSDFAKLKRGQQRFDPWGGHQQIVTYIARFLTSQTKTQAGRIIPIDRAELTGKFALGKTSPPVGIAADVLRGETFVGEEVTATPEGIGLQLWNRLVSFGVQDLVDALRLEGLGAAAVSGTAAFIGIGAQTYEPSPSGKLQATLDQVAQASQFKKPWDDLGPKQQEFLRRTNSAVFQAEQQAEKTAFQKEQVGFSQAAEKEQLQVAKEIKASLPKNIAAQMDLLRMRVILGRTSGPEDDRWRMNDARYKEYQAKVTVGLQAGLPILFASPAFKQAGFKEQQELTQDLLDKVRQASRDFIRKQADVTPTLRLKAAGGAP